MNELKRFRRRHLLSQVQAARAVGIGHSSWRQQETGFRGREPILSLILHLRALDTLAEQSIPWPDAERIYNVEDDQR